MFWTRAILWKIIKVLGYLIGMVRYYPARKKKYFFCPILDTSTCISTHILYEHGKRRHGLKEPAILDGAFRCQRHLECLHPQQLRESRRINGTDHVFQWKTTRRKENEKFWMIFQVKSRGWIGQKSLSKYPI